MKKANMNPNERKILSTTCFGHFMSHFNMLVFPALVLPLTVKYGMGLAQVLALSFWMYLLFGVTALPWGLLSDKFGAKPLLLVFYTGAGFCGLAAGWFVDDPGTFSLCLAGVGLFSGIYHPAGLGLISKGIERMSMALGYNGMAGNAGLAAAPILAGLINHYYGIETAFYFLGGCNLLGALLMVALPLQEPEKKKKSTGDTSGRLVMAFAILCVAMMLGGVAYRCATVVLPSYFELRNPGLLAYLGNLDWFPASRNVAATALSSLVFAIGMLGQYMGGWVAERFEPRRGYLVFHLVALPLALLMAYATDVPLLLTTICYMFFLLGMQPIENSLVAYLTPDRLRHSAYGSKFILTFGVGATAVYVVGWIKNQWSLSAVFVAMAVVSLLIVLDVLLLISRTREMGRG
ncbi:MAG: MFS transporter [Deltaproteobacteria bacterium]|nr:MFS transporter [Deltaproteobacteria bacterium]